MSVFNKCHTLSQWPHPKPDISTVPVSLDIALGSIQDCSSCQTSAHTESIKLCSLQDSKQIRKQSDYKPRSGLPSCVHFCASIKSLPTRLMPDGESHVRVTDSKFQDTHGRDYMPVDGTNIIEMAPQLDSCHS